MTDQPNQKNGKVSWVMFVWAIGIILVAFGWLFNNVQAVQNRVDGYQDDMNQVKTDVSVIKNDVGWIKQVMAEQKAQVSSPSIKK